MGLRTEATSRYAGCCKGVDVTISIQRIMVKQVETDSIRYSCGTKFERTNFFSSYQNPQSILQLQGATLRTQDGDCMEIASKAMLQLGCFLGCIGKLQNTPHAALRSGRKYLSRRCSSAPPPQMYASCNATITNGGLRYVEGCEDSKSGKTQN